MTGGEIETAGGGGNLMRSRVPGDLDEPVRFFGLFTWRDLLRLGIPVGAMAWLSQAWQTSLLGSVAFLFLGWILSLLLYLWRPYSQPFEVNLYHALRWLLLPR